MAARTTQKSAQALVRQTDTPAKARATQEQLQALLLQTSTPAKVRNTQIALQVLVPNGASILNDLSAILIPSYPVEVETRKRVFASQSDAGARQTITKSKSFRFYKLNFPLRKKSEIVLLRPYFDSLYPAQTFLWTNQQLDASGEFYFDSKLTYSPAGPSPDTIDYRVDVRRKLPISSATFGSNVVPFVPSYGAEIEQFKEILLSDALDQTRKARSLSAVLPSMRLIFKNRYLTEFRTAEQFWDYHYPGRKISFTDPVLGGTGDYWLDSDFKWTVRGLNWVEYSFTIRKT